MTSPLLDDNPAERDLLGFEPLQTVLCEVIRDPPRLPFTLGIFAEWGSGKTTLMHLLHDELKRLHVKTVWFNAWKYDSKEVIWNALIQQIFFTMIQDPEIQTASDKREFRKRVKVVAEGLALYAAKVATRFVPGGIVKEEDVEGVLKVIANSATDPLFGFVNSFEEQFDRLVVEYLGEREHLVVFIDDLDRCLPENAINALEALKLYLDRSRCIFVIGAERAIVEEGIRQRYQSSSLSAEDYLDKIIQLPVVLPRADSSMALALLGPSKLEYYDDAAFAGVVTAGTGGNPRRVKRFANAFWILSRMAGEFDVPQARRLAMVLMIQMRFPRLFLELRRDGESVVRLRSAYGGPLAAPAAEAELRDSSPGLAELYGNPELRRFIEATKDIRMGPDDVRPWVELTASQAAALPLGATTRQPAA